MDHSKANPGLSAKEGSNWTGVQQKNAYARLVQQHHSGRFKFYLNYIAQKLQLEEASHGDTVCDRDSAVEGLQESSGRNGLHSNTLSSYERSSVSRFENGLAVGDPNRKGEIETQPIRKLGNEDGDFDPKEKDVSQSRPYLLGANLQSPKGNCDFESRKESQAEKQMPKSQACSKGVLREIVSEGMASVQL